MHRAHPFMLRNRLQFLEDSSGRFEELNELESALILSRNRSDLIKTELHEPPDPFVKAPEIKFSSSCRCESE